jgi:hypothetical protein
MFGYVYANFTLCDVVNINDWSEKKKNQTKLEIDFKNLNLQCQKTFM